MGWVGVDARSKEDDGGSDSEPVGTYAAFCESGKRI